MTTIRGCWERKARHSASSGKVTVAFSIQPSGRVSRACAARNGTGSTSAEQCVLTGIQRMSFAPGPVGGSVSYEYAFVFGSS